MNTKKIIVSTLVAGATLAALNLMPLTALADNPVPAITSLSPTSITAGSTGSTLTVNGSNFVSGSTINVNGSSRPTTFVSPSQLTATLPTSDFTNPGTLTISVVSPGP